MIVRPVLCRPFVGRLEELAYLRERRLEAGSSHGGLVLLAGDAGVGKSRLISEFCGSLAYSRWLIGQGPCLEFASRPYGPVLDALAQLDPEPFELGAPATKHERFDAIVERFAALAARKALVVVIEDLHWADAATLDLLDYLGSKLHRLRILVVASFRADDLHPEHPATAGIAKLARTTRAGRIDLSPLRGVELRTFIDEALAGLTLPDETRRAIALTGDGNPFFTEELLKSAVERSATVAGASARENLPHTVRVALLERLRPLDDDERRIVTQAAVIGRTFGLELLAATLETQPDRLLPALRRARDFQLVEEVSASVFRFRHALTREAIYADFLGAELRPRHRTIALALEKTPGEERTLEALAYHWWAAGDESQAAHYNELAGDAAVRVHAHEDAIASYERVLALPYVDALTRGSILEKIAEARIALTWSDEAQATFGRAAAIFRDAGAREREAACRARAAISAYVLGLPDPTAPLEEMLTRLEPDDFMSRSRLHLGIAWIAASLWCPSRAERHLAQVDDRARLAAADIDLRFHNVVAWVAMTLAERERFVSEHALWVAAARAMDSPGSLANAYYNGALCFSVFGMHEEALQNVALALAVGRESRNRHCEESAQAIGALCYLTMGDLERARRAAEAVPTTTENKINASLAGSCAIAVGCHTGDEALVTKWFAGFEADVSTVHDIESGAAFAEVMVRRGRPREAADLLARAIPEGEVIRGNAATLLAAGRYAGPVARARARRHLARAAEGPDETIEHATLQLFDALDCRRQNRPDEAAVLARNAADGFRRLRTPLLEAEALELAGDVDAALELFRRSAASADVRRLEAKQPLNLSAREREIALLAAEGRANLEIARRLSITHKTVEKHLASVYLKLGISSRHQLAATLAESA